MQLSSFSFCSPSVTASKFDLAEVEKSSRKSEMAAVEKDSLDRSQPGHPSLKSKIPPSFCFLICLGHAINFRG